MTTLRGTAVTARVGTALGIAIGICFVTGLLSHFIQHPQPWFLDRDYRLALWVSLAAGWTAVPAYQLLARRRRAAHHGTGLPVGQDDVVEHQRANDVERQPPAV